MTEAKKQTTLVWVGRVLSALPAAVFLMSAAMKFIGGGPEMEEGLAHLGLEPSIVIPIAVVELICVSLYIIPPTSILGAILLTGYLGGTILAHWRVGDLFVFNVVLGVLLWLGLFLREPRLRELIPLRRLP